jgi:D-lactate dehydrogenase
MAWIRPAYLSTRKTVMVNNRYDVMHFEALGPEASHLEEATAKAIAAGALPSSHSCLITPLTIHSYVEAHPGTFHGLAGSPSTAAH